MKIQANKLFNHGLLLIGSAVMLIPFLWLVNSSFKKSYDIFKQPPDLIPKKDFVELDGKWIECEIKEQLEGLYKVKALDGAKEGLLFEISSAKIEGDKFISPENGIENYIRMEVLEKIKKIAYKVEVIEEGPLAGQEFSVEEGKFKRTYGLQFRNYIKAMTSFNFFKYLINTILLVIINILAVILSSSLAAYGFAKTEFPGKNFLFMVLLSTMMLPGIVLLIPHFQMFKWMDVLDTYWPLIIPSFFGAPFYIFLLRQFFMSIPKELSEAARIDGCSEASIYFRIILPLSRPALATIAIFTFMGVWNDLIGPLIYLFDMDKFTLALGLASFKSEHSTKWHLLMASSVIMVVPVIILFFSCQRFFIKGITMTGMKN